MENRDLVFGYLWLNLVDDLVFQTAKILPGPLMIVLRRSKLLSHGSIHIADDGGFLGKGKAMLTFSQPLIPGDPVVTDITKELCIPFVSESYFAERISYK